MKSLKLKRFEGNPILVPDHRPWRNVVTFNPGAIVEDGVFYLVERACSSLVPFVCQFGLWKSTDGFHFELVQEEPVFTREHIGCPEGTVEDPRLAKYGDTYYMTYVQRNYTPECYPQGKGIPKYVRITHVPKGDPNNYRSGIARSKDLIHWEDMGLMTPPDNDDRDCVLFPEMVNGRYAMLRRPMYYVGPQYGCDRPSIWLSYSDDLMHWEDPVLVATAQNNTWEQRKIGASGQPVRTDKGWLTLYHGVDQNAVYRTGVMLLDLNDPTKVIARAPDVIFEPEAFYEITGLVIPRVVFPSATVAHNGTLFVYYGCCDTWIGAATVALDEILDYVCRYPTR